MKTFYFLICLIFIGTLLNAQQFSTQFYFTDTLGNQDSVTVGFDPGATRGIDSIFGEVDLKEVPFGDDFEVRIGQINCENLGCFPGFDPDIPVNFDSNQTGIIVQNGEKEISGLSCINGVLEFINSGRTTFFVKNSALPMRINWDTLTFLSTCINQTFITDWHPNLWFDVTCGNSPGPFFENFDEITELWINEPTNVQIIDRSGDTLSMVHLGWDGDLTSSTEAQSLPTFKTFPNPAQDHLTIQFPEAKNRSWKLFNVNGEIVQTGEITTATGTIELQQLPVGIYFLRVDGFQMERVVIGFMHP